MKGYTGKILHVNLTTGIFTVEKPNEKFYRKYLGGSLIGAYYVMKGMDPNSNPLSPDNIIVFSGGPINGAAMSGASRFSVVSKSPQSNSLAVSEAGGYWANEFKRAGFDALVIKGKAEKPVYLWIHDGEYELRDAKNIWGKVTKDVQNIIREELGDNKIRVAQTGPAGEKLCIYANIVNELAHFNGRNGMGAVMGSKNLRAIAVRGSLQPEFHDKDTLTNMAKFVASEVKNNVAWSSFKRDGTNNCVDAHIALGGLPTNNWSSGKFKEEENLRPVSWNEKTIKPGTCFACAVSCKRHVDNKKMPNIDSSYGGPEYETVGICGSNIGIGDHETICKINEICAKYAIDTISFGGTVAYIMDCFEHGLITTNHTNGLVLNFSSKDAIKLAELTGKVTPGIGALCAMGSKRLSEYWAKKFKNDEFLDYAVHVKGKELPAHMPQVKGSLALTYALVTIGADHISSEMDTSMAKEPLSEIMKYVGMENAQPSKILNNEKAKLFWKTQIAYSATDCASVCQFLFGFWTIFEYNGLCKAINAATGWNMNVKELFDIGERRIQMLKAFNTRVGFSSADDILPKKMFLPLKGGITDGAGIDEKAFFNARDFYYLLAGWDKSTGRPSDSRLSLLNLEWVIDYLNVK